MRRSRQEILELFQACQTKLGRTPGALAFYKTAGVKDSEVLYYWPSHSALAKEAGGQPNKFKGRLDDSVVFEGYAKICIYLVVVGPSFRESDLTKLGNYLSQTAVRSVVLITARALMRKVEQSIRDRSTFS